MARGPPDIRYREATVADAPALARMDAECFPHHPYPERLMRDIVERGAFCPVAEMDGGLGAFAMVDVHPRTGDGLLITLDVGTLWRRRGLGTALVGLCAREVARAGGSLIVLTTALGNAPARALYVKLGFRDAGVIEGYYGNDDALVMVHEDAAALAALAPDAHAR
jgi:ribosomal-protein-alanine N-acetyltransferase